jgi:DUF1680 family protein
MKRLALLSLTFIIAQSVCVSAADVAASFGKNTGEPGPGVTTAVARSAQPFALTDVRLLEGLFRDAMLRDQDYLLSLDPDRLLRNFRVNVGLPTDARPLGGWESPDCELRGHSLGHYLSALSLMYASTGDVRFKQRAEHIVSVFAQCQSHAPAAGFHPGYLSAFPESFIDRVEQGQSVWAPWYTLHKIMAGLLDASQLCGNAQALAVLTNMANWVQFRVDRLTTEQMQRSLETEFGGMNEVLVNLYAVTGNTNHLRLAQRFHHRRVIDPLEQGQDRLDGLHANTQIPKIIGLTREYELTGHSHYLTAANTFWNAVALHRSYVIGGHSDYELFFPVLQFDRHLSPETCETCNTYNMLKLTQELFALEPSAHKMDFYERGLYNHILASQDPESGMVTYYVALKPGHFKVYSTPEESFWCCTGTGMENHAKYGGAIYSHGADSLYVNLFIASELKWSEKGLSLRQESRFPETDTTTLTFEAEKPVKLALKIRHPAWAVDGVKVFVNGRLQKIKPTPGSYFTLDRKWRDGDTVKVSLPMRLHTETLPGVSHQVAILYGPVVLAGELGTNNLPDVFARDQRAYDKYPDSPVPVWVTSREALLSSIKPVAGVPLTFRTHGIGRPEDVTLKPFHRIHRQRYSVYWRLLTPEQWQAQQAVQAAAEARRLALEKRTVDRVQPGEPKSEQDHQVRGEKSDALEALGRRLRHARDGGWFSYELKVDPTAASELVCTWWGDESGQRHVLTSRDGVASPELVTDSEKTPYGRATIRVATVSFPEHKLTLQLRLGEIPGQPCVLLQPLLQNQGTQPVKLVSLAAMDMPAPPLALQIVSEMSGIRVDPGETRVGQQAVLWMREPRVALVKWADWVAQTHHARTDKGALAGWCSWYHLTSHIKGGDVRGVVDEVKKQPDRLRPQVIQIDDGYQDFDGVWDANAKFPEGMPHYAQRIAETSARPGLWMALTIIGKQAPWLQDTNNVAAVWNQALGKESDFRPDENGWIDPTHPRAIAHILDRVRHAVTNGFTYLKLDFNNIGNGGWYEQKKTSLQILREHYTRIRQVAGENVYIMACMVEPNRAVVGLVDAHRSSHDAHRGGVRSAVNDVLCCSQINQRWFAIDNDIYYLAPDVPSVGNVEGGWDLHRTWLSLMGLSFGAALTSDPWHWPEMQPHWRTVELMQPPAEERAEVLDLGVEAEWPRVVSLVKRPWGHQAVAVLWNPSNSEKEITLQFAGAGLDPAKPHAVWSFWDSRYLGLATNSWTTPKLAPNACQHLVFTPVDWAEDRPVLIGSSLHIHSGAAEIERVQSSTKGIKITLSDAGAREGDLLVFSKTPLEVKEIQGCEVAGFECAGDHVWKISLRHRQPNAAQSIELAGVKLPKTCYRFSYFLNNGEDGLHLAWSTDGLKWKALKGGKSFLTPAVGNAKLMRDPCVLVGPDGTFHMVWTDSWFGNTIGDASSRDLIHWSEQRALPVMSHEPGARNCWAPEIAYDAAQEHFLIFWASTIDGRFPETELGGQNDLNHRIYATTTRDFRRFAPATMFFNPGYNVIDATLLASQGKAVMIFKDETKVPVPMKNLWLATAPTTAGPCTVAPNPSARPAVGWRAPARSRWATKSCSTSTPTRRVATARSPRRIWRLGAISPRISCCPTACATPRRSPSPGRLCASC